MQPKRVIKTVFPGIAKVSPDSKLWLLLEVALEMSVLPW